MRIESSQQMFQHIENGGNLKLNKEGQLESQSAVGRFFQKIGDAFRSLTASGRAAIETRNARLHEAMADMVRRDALVNPAQANIQSPMTERAQHNEFAMRLGLAQGLSKLPKEARAAARNLALHVLHSKGMPGQGDPASVGRETQSIMRHIEQTPALRDGLRCDYARNNAQLQPLLREMTGDLRAEYMHQKDRHISKDGMHDSYVKDATRGSVRSINGHAPNAADFEGEFEALIPDKKMRGFLSMMASQAGLEGSLCKQLLAEGMAKDNPDFPGYQEMIQNGLLIEFPHHKYDISVEDGQARIRLEMDAVVKAHMFEGELIGQTLGGGRYSVEMVVDLNQDMTGKDIPDFTLVNASRTPIPMEAPDFSNSVPENGVGENRGPENGEPMSPNNVTPEFTNGVRNSEPAGESGFTNGVRNSEPAGESGFTNGVRNSEPAGESGFTNGVRNSEPAGESGFTNGVRDSEPAGESGFTNGVRNSEPAGESGFTNGVRNSEPAGESGFTNGVRNSEPR